MLEIYLLCVIFLIGVLTLLTTHYNRRQAEALDRTARAAADWLLLEIRRHREQKQQSIHITDPLDWFGRQANCVVQKLERSFTSFPALEFAVAGGHLVVSPLSPRELRGAIRRSRHEKHVPKAFRMNAVPLLRYDWLGQPRAEVTARGLREDEWFDVEVDQILEQLELQWGTVDRLWFYQTTTHRR